MGTNITPVQTSVPSFPLLGIAMAATSSALGAVIPDIPQYLFFLL
jgi:hypothetical protein